MTNKKISALTAASTPLAGTETLPIVQSGATVAATVNNVLTAGLPVVASTVSATGAISAKGTETTTGGTLGAWAQSSIKVPNRSGAGDLSSINFGYTANNTLTYAAAFVTYNNTSGAGNGLGDVVIGTRVVVTDTAPTTKLTIGSSGDVTVNTGNLIPGTAAKGINFTANTPASGMTSQLLNWYEEGTWTPTPSGITVVSGTPVYIGYYVKVGKQITLNWYMSGGNITTVAGTSKFTNMPFSNGNSYCHGIFQNELTFAFGPMESGPAKNLFLNANITGSYMAGTITYISA